MNRSDPNEIIGGRAGVSAGDTRERYREKIARITLDSMVQFVGLLDAKGTVLEINKVALDAVGIKLSEVEGKPFWTTFWWQVSAEINATLRESILRAGRGEFVRWDTPIYGRAGGKDTIIIDASLCPVLDDKGNVVFICAEGRDITEKKAYEREIARQREELAELDKLKTKFFANISHEFRTPLTLILGPVEEMLGESYAEVGPQAKGQLEVVHRNSLRLLKLVNTMLDFSRIEAGRVQASYEPTDLAAYTAELAGVFRAAVERAGMRLAVSCTKMPEPAYIDRDMWEKIVLNLLSNAFKFTFQGEIEVRLEGDDGHARLTVRDTGVGIPAEELPRVFERFHRVHESRGRTHEGTGIGLALVQELIRLHGGSVSADSVLNEGSRFVVTIPLGKEHLDPARIATRASPAPATVGAAAFVEEALRWVPFEAHEPASAGPWPAAPISDGPRPRVLWADDNADVREYVARLLSPHFDVTTAADGRAALEAAQANPPDIVLSDAMMPRLDGVGLLRALRENPATKTLPVILLSARAGEEARSDGMSSGADDYLVKPFSARELLARVNAHLKLAQERKRAEETLRVREERQKRVLETDAVGVLFFDHAGVVVDANEAFLRMTGYTRAQIEHRELTWRRMTPGEWVADSEEQMRRLTETGRIGPYEKEYWTADGSRRWMLFAGRDLGDGTISEYCIDITDRKRAEDAVRQNEARQAFLLNLGDALRTLADPLEMQETAVRVLREHLNVAGAYYFELDPDGDSVTAERSYSTDPIAIPKRLRISDFGSHFLALYRAGRTVVIPDMEADPEVGERQRAAFRAIGMRAVIGVPLLKDGRFAAALGVHQPAPRDWTEGERRLLEDVAERIWAAVERARAEAALRSSKVSLAGQKEAFQAAVNGAPLETSMGVLVRTAIEQADTDVRCAFYIADPRGRELRHVAGMPDSYAECVDGFKIGPDSLACGLAVYTGQPVVTPDVMEEPRWRPWLWLAERYRFRAVWSFPIETSSGKIVGTFAMYFESPRAAAAGDYESAAVLTRAAAIIISRTQEAEERVRAEELLSESEARYRVLAESLPQLVWTCLPDGRCDYLSRQWVEYTGVPESEQLGLKWLDRAIHPDDRKRTREHWMGAVAGLHPYDIDYRIRAADDAYRWFQARGVALRNSQGAVVKWFGTCTDIDQQKRVENELRRANSDLEQFAYSASHDLREPLRNVAIYSELFHKEYAGKLDAQADQFLGYMIEGAQRVENLLSDLLAYAYAAEIGKDPAGTSDAENVLEKVLTNLHRSIDESKAVVTHDPLPAAVSVKEVHLEQLFQNLVGNSIKYRKDSEAPRIHVSANRENAFWRFSVQDNGIGIDPRFYSYVFGLFKRLHVKGGKYDGTGLGLAICNKIVQRYGGRIWLESQPGAGTVFYFTLPE